MMENLRDILMVVWCEAIYTLWCLDNPDKHFTREQFLYALKIIYLQQAI